MESSRTEEVRFSASRCETGPLTWAQRLLWSDTQWLKPDDHFYNIALQFKVPDGHSLKDVLSALTALVQRHESLRTRFVRSDSGEPVQQVTSEGALSIEILSAGAADADATAGAWLKENHDIAFDFSKETSARIAVLEVAGSPRRALFIISHMALDQAGGNILRTEFERILVLGADSRSAQSAVYQPLDRAAYEATKTGRRQSEMALGYWADVLQSTPARMFAYPPQHPEKPRYVNFAMKSEAVSTCLDILTERYQATNASVLVAATAAMLSTVTGSTDILLKTVSNNRFVPDLKDLLGIALGNSIMAVPVGGHKFGKIIQRVSGTTVAALMHAQLDSVELSERVARMNRERGVYTDLFEAFINDRRYFSPLTGQKEFSLAELRQMALKTVVYRDGTWERQNAKFFLDAGPGDSGGGDVFSIMADTAFISAATIKQMLRGLESLLITETHREVDSSEISAIVGIPEPARGDSWKLIDQCWADLDRSRDVLRQVTGGSQVGLFPVDSGEGLELVAYVRSEDPLVTPETIHSLCVEALEENPTAMAAGRYVICRSAPASPAEDEASWLRQPVVCAGTGRGR
ncbi:condensation domain-containing protein [Streptomyces sp. NPDC006012]|uniref:condensation domain-containing protein n=1 Tax=Streptomyces sp. NPDC006012 TaxID=3364739 RepID=UPI0036B062A7